MDTSAIEIGKKIIVHLNLQKLMMEKNERDNSLLSFNSR